jgi:hypothetical protein
MQVTVSPPGDRPAVPRFFTVMERALIHQMVQIMPVAQSHDIMMNVDISMTGTTLFRTAYPAPVEPHHALKQIPHNM